MSVEIFRGAFIMRYQDHGILTSTYFNNNDSNPYPETAKKNASKEPEADPFIGTFNVVWLEEKDHPFGYLTIEREKYPLTYILIWKIEDKIKFQGRAVREGNMLFGYYWKD